MDPPEPIHGVIGVDRALGLRVTVRELPPMSCWEATLPTPPIQEKISRLTWATLSWISFSNMIHSDGYILI